MVAATHSCIPEYPHHQLGTLPLQREQGEPVSQAAGQRGTGQPRPPPLLHCPEETGTFSRGPRRPPVCKRAERRAERGTTPLGARAPILSLQQVMRNLGLSLPRSSTNTSDS